MPPHVNPKKCNGCEGRTESFCEEICPGDLMFVGEDGKAHCRSLRDCWDCMCCTKACPRKAIETRIPFQLGYVGARLVPFVGRNAITWKCTDIHGKTEIFKYRNRIVKDG